MNSVKVGIDLQMYIKIARAICRPRYTLKIIKYKYRINFSNLDPTKVTLNQAIDFFAMQEHENESLIFSIQAHIEKSDVIFDVGANAGFFSKMILENGYKGKIVLFEPIDNLVKIA